MLISFKHRFVFVKTYKVAGTSVEVFLRQIMGDDDVITPITPRDEYIALGLDRPSRNYALSPADEKVYENLVAGKKFEEAIRFLGVMSKRFVGHMTLADIISVSGAVGKDVSMFHKFTIERHPYSFMVSLALYDNDAYNRNAMKTIEPKGVDRMVAERLEKPDLKGLINNNFYYSGAGGIGVDTILKYENLREDLLGFLVERGVDLSDEQLPDLKKNVRHLDAFELLSESTKKISRKCFIFILKHLITNLSALPNRYFLCIQD